VNRKKRHDTFVHRTVVQRG